MRRFNLRVRYDLSNLRAYSLIEIKDSPLVKGFDPMAAARAMIPSQILPVFSRVAHALQHTEESKTQNGFYSLVFALSLSEVFFN